MLGRIISKLILWISPFVLAGLSVIGLLADAADPAEPTPITLTDVLGKVQKLSPKEGILKDVIVGEVVEPNEQVLTNQNSSTRMELSDQWIVQMEPLSSITIQELNQGEDGLHTRVKFEIGTVDIALSIGSLDVETPSGMVSLHGPARAYLKVKMNSGETWAYCLEGACNLEKRDRKISLSPGQAVTFSQYTDLTIASEAAENCAPPADWVTHIVQKGENLKQLSLFYQVPVSAIQSANCMGNSHSIQAGDELLVPNNLIPTATPILLSPPEISLGNTTETLQPTATETPTPNPISIPNPTATQITFPTATKTTAPQSTNTPKPTATNTSVSYPTNNPAPTATNTPVPNATNTPKPTPTNTPVTYPTNIPNPTSTNTPPPTPTNTAIPTATATPSPTPTNTAVPLPSKNVYYLDVNNGSDSNPGTIEKPWQTMIKAFRSLHAGDTLYIREGVYITEWRSGRFEYSGTAQQPITVTNYPGEKVEIRVSSDKGVGWEAFMCWADAEGSTPKVDYVRIIGTGGGLLVRGTVGPNIVTAGIWGAGNCDHWEVAGVTFQDLGSGIFNKKLTYGTIYDYSPDYWYVHDNIVNTYYRESGMQFNGNYNIIENNQIYKVANVSSQYGCQFINLLGHHNIVRGNILSRQGSNYDCLGILFEWDIADENIVEYNTILDVGFGGDGAVLVAGGDNNVIRYNTIHTTTPNWFSIYPIDSGTGWPCNDAASIIPADDPRAPDYPYFYPHDCKSVGNQEYDNTYIAP